MTFSLHEVKELSISSQFSLTDYTLGLRLTAQTEPELCAVGFAHIDGPVPSCIVQFLRAFPLDLAMLIGHLAHRRRDELASRKLAKLSRAAKFATLDYILFITCRN